MCIVKGWKWVHYWQNTTLPQIWQHPHHHHCYDCQYHHKTILLHVSWFLLLWEEKRKICVGIIHMQDSISLPIPKCFQGKLLENWITRVTYSPIYCLNKLSRNSIKHKLNTISSLKSQRCRHVEVRTSCISIVRCGTGNIGKLSKWTRLPNCIFLGKIWPWLMAFTTSN